VYLLVTARGNIVQSYGYDAFGNIQQRGDDINQPYAYTGQQYDQETGLYYYRARYYDPGIGRFISEDPIAGILTNPQGFNRYIYANDNPSTYVDPSGRYAGVDDLFASGIGLVGGLVGQYSSDVIHNIAIGRTGATVLYCTKVV
jgi:RHS repeat-associated protein